MTITTNRNDVIIMLDINPLSYSVVTTVLQFHDIHVDVLIFPDTRVAGLAYWSRPLWPCEIDGLLVLPDKAYKQMTDHLITC